MGPRCAEAKRVDREAFDPSLVVPMVLHDMPQHDNRVDLDESVVDAWGLPFARITLKPHRNDIDRGRDLIDRGADVLEASGARSVSKVYADRMGDDPDTSVLDRRCRAHAVRNPYVVDGSPFPTATGANPTLTIMINAWRVAEHIVASRGTT